MQGLGSAQRQEYRKDYYPPLSVWNWMSLLSWLLLHIPRFLAQILPSLRNLFSHEHASVIVCVTSPCSMIYKFVSIADSEHLEGVKDVLIHHYI